MCNHDDKETCRHPERLGDKKPGQCSPEQIQKCHGREGHHCCKEQK